MGRNRRFVPFYKSEYGYLLEPEPVVKRASRPSLSRVPVKCVQCREWLTVRGRAEGRCTECHTLYHEAVK